MTEMIPTTNWRNIGLIWASTPGFSHWGVATPWGNLLLKPYSQRLFSERYGYARGIKLGSLYLRWVRLRRFPS